MKDFFSVVRDFGIAVILAVSFPICVHLGINVFYPKFQDLSFRSDFDEKFLTAGEFKRFEVLKDKQEALGREFKGADGKELRQLLKTRDLRLEELRKKRSSVVFYVSLFIALLLVAISLIVPVPSVSAGLVLSGLAVGVDGYWRTWKYLDVKLKFISLIVAIVLLIAVSFISFYRSNEGKKR